MLPKKYPKWSTVYYYFNLWKSVKIENETVFDLALCKLVADERLKDDRLEKTTFVIVDAQSIKNTDSSEESGYDAGKKVKGIKRHIAVDILGLPHAIGVTTANVTDRDGAIQMFNENKNSLINVVNIMVDRGYTGEIFASKVKDIIGATVEVVKRNELHKFKVVPKRWIVERTFGWLEKCRRLWKNCERKLETSLQMVKVAFIALLLKRF